jgi:hypothetical protein
MTDPGPDPVTEQWIFGGSVIHSGRRAHLWLDPTGRELVYAAQGSYAVGFPNHNGQRSRPMSLSA